jgi:hypothetical protein
MKGCSGLSLRKVCDGEQNITMMEEPKTTIECLLFITYFTRVAGLSAVNGTFPVVWSSHITVSTWQELEDSSRVSISELFLV